MAVTVYAYCTSGALHTLSLHRDGTLEVVDHDLEAERIAAELGAEEPRCVRFLRRWQKNPIGELTSFIQNISREDKDRIALGALEHVLWILEEGEFSNVERTRLRETVAYVRDVIVGAAELDIDVLKDRRPSVKVKPTFGRGRGEHMVEVGVRNLTDRLLFPASRFLDNSLHRFLGTLRKAKYFFERDRGVEPPESAMVIDEENVWQAQFIVGYLEDHGLTELRDSEETAVQL